MGRNFNSWHAPLILGWALLLPGCGQPIHESGPPSGKAAPSSTHSGGEVDLETVRAFFADLSGEPATIDPTDPKMRAAESQVFRWVIASIPKSHLLNIEIQEIRLSKTSPGSRFDYQLGRHAAQGFVPLTAGQDYVQLHVVHSASDPELHGVVDVEGPRLLSFWGEGA